MSPNDPVLPAGATAANAAPGGGISLGRRLRIRSMVNVAGEVLPFFWPMRSFIHHNPLHGFEHLPFAQAIQEATRLFHARGWLPRPEYQRLLAAGEIDPVQLEALIGARVEAWLAEQDHPADPVLAELLRRILAAMLTRMDQPAPGDREPCAEEVLACLRDPAAAPAMPPARGAGRPRPEGADPELPHQGHADHAR